MICDIIKNMGGDGDWSDFQSGQQQLGGNMPGAGVPAQYNTQTGIMYVAEY